MRRTAVLVLAAVAALSGAAADALPLPCRTAAVDPKGDTYRGLSEEPNADLRSVAFARSWGTLDVAVGLDDVDADGLGTLLGREIRAMFTVDGTRFVARYRENGDVVADVSRVSFVSPHSPAGEPGAWEGVRWDGDVGWSLDTARNAVVIHVPLRALEDHGVVVGPATEVTRAAAETYAVAWVAGVDEDPARYERTVGVQVDEMAPSDATYRLGEGSCR